MVQEATRSFKAFSVVVVFHVDRLYTNRIFNEERSLSKSLRAATAKGKEKHERTNEETLCRAVYIKTYTYDDDGTIP